MARITRSAGALVAALIASLALPGVAGRAAATPPALAPPAATPTPQAKAYLLADLNTGRVISGYDDHALMPPASLTKMLTALIAVNRLPPNAKVPVTKTAAGVYPDKVGMRPGQVWPLSTTLHSLLIVSANDAAYALAQRVSGSIARFGPTMETAATELGMTDRPVFHDPAGLDGTEGFAGGNRMSAWDVAIAARDLLENPRLRPIVGTLVYWFTSPSHVVNKLVNFNESFLNSYPGAIGIKTGFTDSAGMCVAEAATRGTRTMLAIVMNGVSPNATAATLLSAGFRYPVAREHGPLLPPVRQPSPPAQPQPQSRQDGAPPIAAVGPLPVPLRSQKFPTKTEDYAAFAVLGLGLVLLVSRGARRLTRAPMGAHSDRRRP